MLVLQVTTHTEILKKCMTSYQLQLLFSGFPDFEESKENEINIHIVGNFVSHYNLCSF